MPLLEGTDGVKKMSKSYGNYIALNDTPKDMFGKVMSISDTLMIKYFELLTQRDLNEVKQMHPREAKASLAEEITSLYHGCEAEYMNGLNSIKYLGKKIFLKIWKRMFAVRRS